MATKKTPPTADSFADAFAGLRKVLVPLAKGLEVTADGPKAYMVNAGYSKKWKKVLFFAGVRLGKAYVSFHLFPLYMFPDLADGLSPELKARMQGKSCFNFRKPEPALFRELSDLSKKGLARMQPVSDLGVPPR